MAERKPLFISGEGFSEEMASSDSLTLGGLSMGGAIAMGTNKITGLGDGTVSTDAATYGQVQAMAAGLSWKNPVAVVDMLDDSDEGGSAPTAQRTGDARVVNNWGGTYNDGDIVEWDGAAWQVIVANSAGEPPDGTRVLVAGPPSGTVGGSFTGQAEKIGTYVVSTSTWTFETPSQSWAVLVSGGVSKDEGYTFNGTDWVQFTGAATITAGDGLQKVGSTISVKKGDGIEVTSNSNAVNIDLATNPGLALSGTSPNKELTALVSASGGVQIDGANGLALLLDGNSLSTSSSGVKVGHAPRVQNSSAVGEAVAVADPLYWTSTNDRVGKGDAASDAKSRIIGLATTAQAVVGDPVTHVSHGLAAGVLSGATAGTQYFLQSGGGIGTTVPSGSVRVILIGWAINATDLWVNLIDYGKKAA